jgi:hypothetical protein
MLLQRGGWKHPPKPGISTRRWRNFGNFGAAVSNAQCWRSRLHRELSLVESNGE